MRLNAQGDLRARAQRYCNLARKQLCQTKWMPKKLPLLLTLTAKNNCGSARSAVESSEMTTASQTILRHAFKAIVPPRPALTNKHKATNVHLCAMSCCSDHGLFLLQRQHFSADFFHREAACPLHARRGLRGSVPTTKIYGTNACYHLGMLCGLNLKMIRLSCVVSAISNHPLAKHFKK